MEINNIQQPSINLETLILNLKTEDTRHLKKNRRIQWLLWPTIAMYLFLSVVNIYLSLDWHLQVGVLLVMLSLFLWVIYIRKSYKEYKIIDYGLPIMEMLLKAAFRYQFFSKQLLFALFFLILEVIGATLICYPFYVNLSTLASISIALLILVLTLAISFVMSYFAWKKRNKPLRDQVLALIKELES